MYNYVDPINSRADKLISIILSSNQLFSIEDVLLIKYMMSQFNSGNLSYNLVDRTLNNISLIYNEDEGFDIYTLQGES